MSNSTTRNILYVGGIDNTITKQLLHAAFIPFGDIIDVTIPVDEKNESRAYGFVEFEQSEDAAAALENMNLAELNGRVLTVNFAKSNVNAFGMTYSGDSSAAADEEMAEPQAVQPVDEQQDSEPRKKKQKN